MDRITEEYLYQVLGGKNEMSLNWSTNDSTTTPATAISSVGASAAAASSSSSETENSATLNSGITVSSDGGTTFSPQKHQSTEITGESGVGGGGGGGSSSGGGGGGGASASDGIETCPSIVTANDSCIYSGNSLLPPTTTLSTSSASSNLSTASASLPSNVEKHSIANMAGIKAELPALHAVSNSTVSAAADSSDNQPPTPTPDHQPAAHHHHHHQQQQHQQAQQHHHHHQQQQQQQHPLYGSNSGLANANQMYQDMHSYHPAGASYLSGYEQFYHASPAGMDYGSAMQQLQQNPILQYQMQNQSLTGAASPHGDYKGLASTQRYHPYLNNGGLHHLSSGQNHAGPAAVSANSGPAANNTSSSVSNSSLSPRVVSSSSPSLNNTGANNTPHHGLTDVNSMTNRTPTPSASKQCNKCGVMCATEIELNEHYSAVHGAQSGEDCINSAERSANSAPERGQYHPFAPYIKEEPPSSDILDLDSQKMVYPPQSDGDVVGGGVNAGLHPMQRPMAWPQELHPAYMSAPHIGDNKHAGYYAKQEFTAIKNEFHPIKTEYVSPTNFGNPALKGADYGQPIAPQTRPDDKPFGTTDLATGNNPVSSSPSEFPSTTTPQDNLGQYRGFEPPTSSLPSSGSSAKSATWKSNEARRPKTYNCTACNKWFTSSGHLKRHYNTTLHKNAVKSSGQPDPATMPISAHHHPSRDPNSKHHRNSQSRQPPPIPPEPPRSPDFSSQYAAQSPNGFPPQTQQQSQAFQQYHPQSNLNSSVNGHPNGLAGPSVQASQPRGLLTISSTEVSIMEQEEDQLHINSNSNNSSSNSSSSSSNNNLHLQEEQYHHQQHQQEVQESSPNNSPNSSLEDYQSTISLQQQQQSQQQQLPLQSPHIISHHQYQELHPIHHQQEPTIFNTATTIHSIMDPQQPQQQQQPQQYIISPLAISTTTPITLNNTTTTIPSFQHLQQPAAEHQQSYHTIIGNNGQPMSNGSQDSGMIQLSSFVDLASLTGQQSFQGNGQNQMQQQSMMTLDSNGQLIQLIQPPIVDIQRFSGGIPSFKDGLLEASSPVAPESYYNRMSPFGSQSSPQEADMPPLHSTASGPQNDQTNPYSPTVSSSTQATNHMITVEELTAASADNSKRPQAAKRKRETTSKASSTTLPTGRIKCDECNKEFTKICYLTQHNKSFHSGEQPYRCQKCGKRFQNEDIYDAHLARHKSLDKPHKCDLCPKQFHHKTDLRRHKEAIHTGFKAHTCDMCNKSFCRKDHLRKHCDIHNRPKQAKKSKQSPAAIRKQTHQTAALTAVIYATGEDATLKQISSLEDTTNSSSSQQSHQMPKLDIKVEPFAMAGEELVYM